MRGRFRLSVFTLIHSWNFYWKSRDSQPPSAGRVLPRCTLELVHTKKTKVEFRSILPPSLPQTCIVSIKICRQWPSCSKQSCPRRIITVSINSRRILDMLETIDVFFIWKLEIKNTVYQLHVHHTDEF